MSQTTRPPKRGASDQLPRRPAPGREGQTTSRVITPSRSLELAPPPLSTNPLQRLFFGGSDPKQIPYQTRYIKPTTDQYKLLNLALSAALKLITSEHGVDIISRILCNHTNEEGLRWVRQAVLHEAARREWAICMLNKRVHRASEGFGYTLRLEPGTFDKQYSDVTIYVNLFAIYGLQKAHKKLERAKSDRARKKAGRAYDANLVMMVVGLSHEVIHLIREPIAHRLQYYPSASVSIDTPEDVLSRLHAKQESGWKWEDELFAGRLEGYWPQASHPAEWQSSEADESTGFWGQYDETIVNRDRPKGEAKYMEDQRMEERLLLDGPYARLVRYEPGNGYRQVRRKWVTAFADALRAGDIPASLFPPPVREEAVVGTALRPLVTFRQQAAGTVDPPEMRRR